MKIFSNLLIFLAFLQLPYSAYAAAAGAHYDSNAEDSESDAEVYEQKSKKPRSSQACTACQKSKSKCRISGKLIPRGFAGTCDNCQEEGKDCHFDATKKRGPKPKSTKPIAVTSQSQKPSMPLLPAGAILYSRPVAPGNSCLRQLPFPQFPSTALFVFCSNDGIWFMWSPHTTSWWAWNSTSPTPHWVVAHPFDPALSDAKRALVYSI